MRVLDVLPASGAVDGGRIAHDAGVTPDEALGRLYELQALGFVERHGEGWQLTRTAVRRSNARRGGP